MKCEKHTWDINDTEWCWKCDELNNPGYYKVHKNSINKIEIGEHCFGAIARVDDEDICNIHDNEEWSKLADITQLKTIEYLKSIRHTLDTQDWKSILEIITSRDQWDYLDDESSHSSTCDQCGGWNNNDVYIKN
jgi:hypothetical protein